MIQLPECSVEISSLSVKKPLIFLGGQKSKLIVRENIEITFDTRYWLQMKAKSRSQKHCNQLALSSTYFKVTSIDPSTFAANPTECLGVAIDHLDHVRVSFRNLTIDCGSDGKSLESKKSSTGETADSVITPSLFVLGENIFLELEDCTLRCNQQDELKLIGLYRCTESSTFFSYPSLMLQSSYLSGFKSMSNQGLLVSSIVNCCLEDFSDTVIYMRKNRILEIRNSTFLGCGGTIIDLSFIELQERTSLNIELCEFIRCKSVCISIGPKIINSSLLMVSIEDSTFSKNEVCIKADSLEAKLFRLINCRLERNLKTCVRVEDCPTRVEISHNLFEENKSSCIDCVGSSTLICYNEMVDCHGGISVSCTTGRALQVEAYFRTCQTSKAKVQELLLAEICRNSISGSCGAALEILGAAYFRMAISSNQIKHCGAGISIGSLCSGQVPEERSEISLTSPQESPKKRGSVVYSKVLTLIGNEISECEEAGMLLYDSECKVILRGGSINQSTTPAIKFIGNEREVLKIEAHDTHRTQIQGEIVPLTFDTSTAGRSECSLI